MSKLGQIAPNNFACGKKVSGRSGASNGIFQYLSGEALIRLRIKAVATMAMGANATVSIWNSQFSCASRPLATLYVEIMEGGFQKWSLPKSMAGR